MTGENLRLHFGGGGGTPPIAAPQALPPAPAPLKPPSAADQNARVFNPEDRRKAQFLGRSSRVIGSGPAPVQTAQGTTLGGASALLGGGR